MLTVFLVISEKLSIFDRYTCFKRGTSRTILKVLAVWMA